MKESLRQAPGPAIAPEVVSDDTHSNLLIGNTLTCVSSATISKTWEPVKKGTGTTDANGNEIFEYVDYVASGTIKDEMDVNNLSSDYYRDMQNTLAKGYIRCTETEAKKAQTSYGQDGKNMSSRVTFSNEVAYYRSQFLVDVIKSLDQKNPIDTVVQDYQIAWSCGGICQDLANKSAASSCRPVYVSELLLGLQSEPLYYSSKDSSPTTFPSDIISAVNSYYPSSYSSRSKGKTFSPLSKSLYTLMYQQLNFIPKGNLNSKVNVYNYTNYTSKATKKDSTNRVIPAGAAAAYGTSEEVFKKLRFSTQTKLANSSLCDNVGTNSDSSRDNTLDNKFSLSADDNHYADVSAGQSYTQKVDIKVENIQNKNVETVAQTAETGMSNLVFDEKAKKIREESFASTTNLNKNSAVSDPYRPNLFYKQLQKSLRFSNWL
jgi:hypothetical protein